MTSFGETISRVFHEVMDELLRLLVDLIRPQDAMFSSIPNEIFNDPRYMLFFKVILLYVLN